MALLDLLKIRLTEYEIFIESYAMLASTDLTNGIVIAKAIKKSYPDGGYIINSASSAYNQYLFEAFNIEGINETSGYYVYNVFLSEQDVTFFNANVYILYYIIK